MNRRDDEATVSDPFEAADEAFKRGDHALSRSLLEVALKAAVVRPVVHYRAAQVEHVMGDLDAAARRYKAALAGEPDNPAYWVHHGRCARERGDVSAGRRAHDRAVILGMPPTEARRNSLRVPLTAKRFEHLGAEWGIAPEVLANARPEDLGTIVNWAALGFVNNVFVQISRRCNLRCAFCGTDVWESNDGFMAVNLFQKVVRKIRDAGKDAVTLVGGQGEPLLNPHAFEMIHIAVDAGLAVTLVSNGNPLNERRARLLAESGASVIGISFAGYDAESYEINYKNGRFDVVARNIKYLSDAIAEQNRSIQFYITGIYSGAVAHLCDFEEFSQRSFDFLKSIGVRNCSVYMTSDPHNFAGNVRAGEWRSDAGIFSTQNIDRSRMRICGGLATMGIFIDGRVTACGCLDANGRLGIGDVSGDASLFDVAASRAYGSYLEAFLRRDPSRLPPLCRGCDYPYREAHHTLSVEL